MSKQEQLKFEELLAVIKQKITSKEAGSYSNSLAQKGLERITRKIGEEAIEVLVAAFMHEKNPQQKTRDELVGEICDLFYHTLILLAYEDIKLEEIFAEFAKRNAKKK